jgi:hypothetical protein
MNIPQLPNDIIINILKERMNIKKDERFRDMYDDVLTDFMLAVEQVKRECIKVDASKPLTQEEEDKIFNETDNADFIMDYVVGDGYNHLNNFLILPGEYTPWDSS